jgi:hypothetical protein
MRLFPRVRQACQRDLQASADITSADARGRQGPGAVDGALCGHSPWVGAASALHGHDSRREVNHVVLTGILAADPQKDKGRNGDPVTLLLIAFPAPDAKDTEEFPAVASCEIEVPGEIAAEHAGELRTGAAVLVSGQLSGGGGVLAAQLESEPPDQDGDLHGRVAP